MQYQLSFFAATHYFHKNCSSNLTLCVIFSRSSFCTQHYPLSIRFIAFTNKPIELGSHSMGLALYFFFMIESCCGNGFLGVYHSSSNQRIALMPRFSSDAASAACRERERYQNLCPSIIKNKKVCASERCYAAV